MKKIGNLLHQMGKRRLFQFGTASTCIIGLSLAYYPSIADWPLLRLADIVPTARLDANRQQDKDIQALFAAACNFRLYQLPHWFQVDTKTPCGGWTLLHVAAMNADLKLVNLLLRQGADPNIREEKPKALQSMEYLKCRQSQMSGYLNPRADTQGFTPLHYAIVSGDVDVIETLLKAGADPTAQSSQGHVPRDYFDPASQTSDIAKLLDEYEKVYIEEKKKKEKEKRKKFPLEQQLREAIVGQAAPINSIGSAIRRKENGWHDEGRPLVFLFLGSSGIGKTELAKQLAKYIHSKGPEGFIRIDMSEFQSKHEVAKFIGSPPGYVGYDEGGQLTEKLQKTPNAVVLLDEVEKAHIDVLTIMLQVFDEGRLTDGKGNTIDCKDAIFIMTSNLAQQEIANEAEDLRKDAENNSIPTDESKSLSKAFVNETIYPILRNHFKRDEFLGRINEILFFLPFDKNELEQIVEMEMKRWGKIAENKHKIKLSWTREVVEKLTEGYNIRYGARSIKYEVEKKVINHIAKLHEQDEIGEGSQVSVSLLNGSFKFQFTKQQSNAKQEGFLFWK